MTVKNNQSAGIVAYRFREQQLQVFLIHPGGPFWQKKDLDAWSIPKGEFDADEMPLDAAKREFIEETGFNIFDQNTVFIELSRIRQKSGKWVYAWACEADFDSAGLKSNLFKMEWPPKSGKIAEFPEVDRGDWFFTPEARKKIKAAQVTLLEKLEKKLGFE